MRKLGRLLAVVLSAALALIGAGAAFTNFMPRVTQALDLQKNQIEKAADESRELIVPDSGLRSHSK